MASVVFDKITRVYAGNSEPSVSELSLEVADGEFLVLVGPSGCGKSTTLRMLAGLEEVNEGAILIGETDVTNLSPKDRDIAMVFQNYALYPHMTVAENMGFALKLAGVKKDVIAQKVLEAAKILSLEEFLTRKPKALSGGQRQRVAMGRAIVRDPKVFLMDEPLSNLDAKLRVSTRTQISALQRKLGVTTIYVTHDQIEALTMGDRIAVLNFGKLQQVGTPTDLYERPANKFVAGFIGSPAMNFVEMSVFKNQALWLGREFEIPAEVSANRAAILVGFRPEAASIQEGGLPIVVTNVEDLGSDGFVYGQFEGAFQEVDETIDREAQICIRVSPHLLPRIGDRITIAIDPAKRHFFDVFSGERVQ